ncbi:hypothetical protein AB6C74_08750 [Vibrio splendidus]
MSNSGLTVDDLSENEISGLKNQVENSNLNTKEDGIGRQILGEEKKPLSEKQQYVFNSKIKPTLSEKCSTCTASVPAGVDYCPTCEIEYGD